MKRQPNLFKKFPNEGTKITENKEQPCLADKTAEKIRERQNLPEGSPVPVMISCPCPKCSNRVMC